MGLDERLVSLEDILAAAAGMHTAVVRTPLLRAAWAGVTGGLWLKAENLQPIGSFKIRGAYTAVARLDPRERAGGLVTHSSGNHAQAVAWSARAFGVPAVIVMPDGTPSVKVDAVRGLGAEIVMVPPSERLATAASLQAERGLCLIPPFDHADVIAGQGTVGLEIAQVLPDVGTVLVPTSGGGLLSGVAAALHALAPQARVVGVEPEFAADLAEGFARGERVEWDAALTTRTIADGLRVSGVGQLPWMHICEYVHDVVTVSEEQILAAMAAAAMHSRLVLEPSGAAALAAALAGASDPEQRPTVAVLTGGCVETALLARVLAAGAPVAAAPY